jgi:poly-beta-1,6-N-acetyl-D-glucosamine synthase
MLRSKERISARIRLSVLRLVAIVSFLDEERVLPTFLDSIVAQTRPPDRLLLVDDGSRDGSAELAEAFARRHAFATALRRRVRPAAADRLSAAAELRAFTWALGILDEPWELVAKLDADLSLPTDTLAAVEARFRDDPGLGIAGPRLLSVDAAGRDVSHRTRREHVEGAVKFYRGACLEQIAPIPPILGWDTIDEVRARMRGWRTAGDLLEQNPVLHLRPMGARDGPVRAHRRWGACAYAYGEHPLYALAMGVRQVPQRPRIVGGLSYVAGWALAALRRAPRAEPELRAYVRRAQLQRLWQRVAR